MKKAISVLICLLFALTALYPTGLVIGACFGYDFELISVSGFAVAIAVLSVCTVVSDLICKHTIESTVLRILSAILTPLSFINAAVYILKCPQVHVMASLLLCTGCCCYLTIKHGGPSPLKTATLVLSALMVLPTIFYGSIALIFGNIGYSKPVQTVDSPSGKYYAQVIDSNDGALGGDTLVNVYQRSGIDAFLFKIEKKPQTVYVGQWGEFKDMQIHWKDDKCLMINAVAYEID